MTKRVMCIDDDVTVGIVFEHCVGDGFSYRYVSDERNAVAECLAFDPNVVFLDLNFPTKDGLTIKQEIEAAGVKATFVFISADERNEKIDAMIKAADCGFLRKPISCEDIAATTSFAVSLNKVLRFTGADNG